MFVLIFLLFVLHLTQTGARIKQRAEGGQPFRHIVQFFFLLFVQRGFWPQPEKHSLFHFNAFSTTLYHSALTAGVLRYHECVWEVPLRPRKHQHVCAACARLNVYNVHLCLCLTDVSRPNLSLRRLARSLPQTVEDRFSASLLEGEEGWRWRRWAVG